MVVRRGWTLALLLALVIATGLVGAVRANVLSDDPVTFALGLDGDGDYLEVADADALDLAGVDGFTLEAWVYRNPGSRCETILGKDYETSYWLGFCDDEIRFYSGGLGTDQDGTTIVPAGVWTHIAVTWEASGNRRYYINGDLDYTGLAETGPPANAFPLFIGADREGGATAYEFSGQLAEVRIWNVARTRDEIRRTIHVTLQEPRLGLVGVWNLSESSIYDDALGQFSTNRQDGASLDLAFVPAPVLRPQASPIDENFGTLPDERLGAAVLGVPELDRALVIGGEANAFAEQDTIYAVDLGNGTSSALGTLPIANTRPAGVYVPLNSTAYLFGGRNGSTYLDDILAIDPTDGSTRTITDTLPTGRSAAAAAYHPNQQHVYVFGGSRTSGDLDEIVLFDPATETVTTPADFELPFRLSLASAAYSSVTDHIYIFGGVINGVPNDTIVRLALATDALTGTFTTLAPTLPEGSNELVALEDPTTGLIYLFTSETVLVFDPLTEQLWQAPLLLPERRRAPGAVYDSRSKQALLIGGGPFFDVPRATIWRLPLGDGPALPLGRWDFPQAVSGQVNTISGDEARVVIGTFGDSAYHYDADGTRTRYPTGVDGLGTTNVLDSSYHEPTGETWFATNVGAVVDNNGTFTTYGAAALGTTDVRAVDVVADPDGTGTWVVLGTNDGMRWTTDNTEPRSWNAAFNGIGTSILTLDHRAPGDVWGTSNDFDADLFQLLYSDTGLPTARTFGNRCAINPANAFAFGTNGDWWLGAGISGEFQAPGICRVPGDSTPGAGNVLSDLYVSDIDTATDGRVWVAQDAVQIEVSPSGSRGIAVYEVLGEPSTATVRTTALDWLNAPLGGTEIGTSSFVPGEGEPVWISEFNAIGAVDERIWAGTVEGELVTVAPRWQQIDESNSLDEKVIEGIWTIRGRVFMAAADELYVLQPDGLTWDNRTTISVTTVLADRAGAIWVGTGDGVRQYLADGWDTFTDTVGISPTGEIAALAADQAGRIWIGGENGLTLYDRDRFVLTFNGSNSPLLTDTVTTLLSDRDNRLWIGSATGLHVLDGSAWMTYTTSDGLPDDGIVDLAQTGDGLIFISTANGLSFYDGSGFTAVTPPVPATGLPLTVDELGRLWAGAALRTGDGWQSYYLTNSGLRSSTISDNAADGAERVWFSHAPDPGVSLRGSFLPPLADVVPTISGINPDQGSSGDLITINGTGFGNSAANIAVTVGGAPAEIVSINPTEIVVRLSDFATSGSVTVGYVGSTRTTFAGVGGRPAFCAAPVITSFSPTGGNVGVEIIVNGTNFDPGARVALGSGALRFTAGGPTQRRLFIESGDSTGSLRVENSLSGCPDLTDTAAETFQRIDLTLEQLVFNQGCRPIR
ncbi:MAG: hypothetical protein HC876_12165 [Chloroflexaceae bacterium]|nr:hypothetical protein [Chloroflexaceae bacterium]